MYVIILGCFVTLHNITCDIMTHKDVNIRVARIQKWQETLLRKNFESKVLQDDI